MMTSGLGTQALTHAVKIEFLGGVNIRLRHASCNVWSWSIHLAELEYWCIAGVGQVH